MESGSGIMYNIVLNALNYTLKMVKMTTYIYFTIKKNFKGKKSFPIHPYYVKLRKPQV